MILNCAIQHNNSPTNRYHIAVQYVECLKKLLFCLRVMILLCGTFVSWWNLPRIWPSVIDMQHYYHARYPTDDWHLAYMFSLVYFSVEVCLEGVFPHSVSTRRDPPPLLPHAGFPLTKKQQQQKTKQNKIEQGVTQLSTSTKRGGHLNWRMGLPVLLGGNLGYLIV